MAPRSPGLPAPLQARRTADRAVRSVRRTKIKLSGLNASVGFPYRAADRAPRRRRAAGEADARRRLRHRVGPAAAGPRRPLDHHQRSAAAGRAGAGVARDPGRRPPGRPPGARHVEEGRLAAGRHLHPQPPQPPRHAACHHGDPRAVARAPRRRGRRRLLLHQPPDQRGVGPRAQRHPDRPQRGRAAVGRPGPRAHRRRLEPASSSPRAAARPTAGGSRSRAAPPSCRSAPARPSCPCSSRAPAPSWARA